MKNEGTDRGSLRAVPSSRLSRRRPNLYFYVIAPGQLDVRYCRQFLSVMQETHGLTVAPTPEQAQQLKDSVNSLAHLSSGTASFSGANAAAALVRDMNSLGSSPSPDDILRITRDADALAMACRSDTG